MTMKTKNFLFSILLIISLLQSCSVQPGGREQERYTGYIDCIIVPEEGKEYIVIVEYLIEAKDYNQLSDIVNVFRKEFFFTENLTYAMSRVLEETDKDPQGIFLLNPIDTFSMDFIKKENGDLISPEEYKRYIDARIELIEIKRKNSNNTKVKEFNYDN